MSSLDLLPSANGRVEGVWAALPAQPMRFVACEMRRERTGIHAQVEVWLKDTRLSWSNFNTGRDEDRARLANAAFKCLAGEPQAMYPQSHLKKHLDNFCAGLKDAMLAMVQCEMVAGSPSQPMPMLLDPFVVEGGGTILYGAPGEGKSFMALLMVVSARWGINNLWQTGERSVLFVNLERSAASVARRIGAVNRALGIPSQEMLPVLNARGRALIEIAEPLAHIIEERDIELLVVDSISRAGAGDLTENAPANRITDTLNRLCPTWIALAHSPRPRAGEAHHAYGSIMFDAAGDVMVGTRAEHRKPGVMGVGLQITKANDVPLVGPIIYALEFGSAGLQGVRKAAPGEFPDLESDKNMNRAQLVEHFLGRVGEATTSEVCEATGFPPATVSRILTRDRNLKNRRDGHRVLYSVKGAMDDGGAAADMPF